MKLAFFGAVASGVLLSLPVLADDAVFVQDPELLRIAVASGICGERDVVRAELLADGNIEATCEDDPTAFVPLLGGLAPVLGIGAAAVAIAAAGGGGSTPDTQ